MYSKSQYCSYFCSPQLDLSSVIRTKVPQVFFLFVCFNVKIEKLVLKFKWKCKEPDMDEINFGKYKAGGIPPLILRLMIKLY